MAAMIIRTELHYASDRDYQTLHDAMARNGMVRTIRSDAGQLYHLPSGTYSYEGTMNRKTVFEAAKLAAVSTGKSSSIIIVASAGMNWTGLTEVNTNRYLSALYLHP